MARSVRRCSIRTGRWERRGFDLEVGLLVLGLLLVTARLALPMVVRRYVNAQLAHIEEYHGSISGVQVNLYRGAYIIRGLQVVKTNANVPVPFITIPEMDLSVEWSQLVRGKLVGKVSVANPRVNFVNGPSESQQQTGLHKSWKQTLEHLFPFQINRFEVKNGRLRFSDPYRSPPVQIAISHLFATATNLTNIQQKNVPLPAGLVARGDSTGDGRVSMNLHMNPLADTPTFKLLASVTNVDLTALNDFMRSYGNFDVEKGTFGLYLDIAAADGKYQGIVKPFFHDLQIFSWHELRRRNILHEFWEAVVGAISRIFRNQPENQLATIVPISGTFETGSDVDLWATIGNLLRNAFVRALLPSVAPPEVPLPTQGPLPRTPSGGTHAPAQRTPDKNANG